MLGFSCSRLLSLRNSNNISRLISNSQLGIIGFGSLLSIKYFSSSDLDPESFTVSYLINSCGLTPNSAESVSKKASFKSPETPDSVLEFLKNHGFSKTHISKIIRQRPQVLLAQPEKLLLPKIEFLRSVGVSSSDLSVILSKNPDMFLRSLDKYLIPRYHILKTALGSDDKVSKTLKHMSVLSMQLLLKNFNVNLSLLREIGVSQFSIEVLVIHHPSVMCIKVDKFAEKVKKVTDMGFEPSKVTFVRALHVFFQLTDEMWERKIEVYRKWGFSDDEILLVFKQNPAFMIRSEEKVMKLLNFVVCQMGWKLADVVRVPVILTSSLEGRITPRCLVAKVLFSKGLIKMTDVSLSSVLMPSDEHFLEWFVIKYQEQVPQLLDLLQGKISLEELGIGLDEKSGVLDHADS